MSNSKLTLSFLLVLLILPANIVSAVITDHPDKRSTYAAFMPDRCTIGVTHEEVTCQRAKVEHGFNWAYFTFSEIPEMKNDNYNGIQFLVDRTDKVQYITLLKDNDIVAYHVAQEGSCSIYVPMGELQKTYEMSCKATSDLLEYSARASGKHPSTPYAKIPFKYDSSVHMKLNESFAYLDVKPEKLINTLNDSFRAQGNLILNSEKLDFYFKKDKNADACVAATNEIIRQEFITYQNNIFAAYKNIDKIKPFSERGLQSDCKTLIMVKDPNVESWFLRVEIPQGNFSSQKVTREFASRLYIWAWEDQETGKTKVYLKARPVNDQVEACNDCTIGYDWWKQVNGYSEFKLVKKYVSLLQEFNKSGEIRIK